MLNKRPVSIFLFVIYFFSVFFLHAAPVLSSNTYFFPANYFPIAQTNIKEGAIVSFSGQTYRLSNQAYDEAMIGVVTNSPAIAQDIQSNNPSYPVLTTGQGYILVSSSNGLIKKGDLLTSSNLPGVAMKATTAGYTIGVALADYKKSDTHLIGKIPVDLNIRFSGVNFTSLLKSVNTKNLELNLSFKYLLAGILVALALFFAFVLISRTINKGIDALGRNPLASLHIHIGMAMNVCIAVILLATGFIMGYFVLQL